MARIPLITESTPDLSASQRETLEWVVKSRGAMIRPYEVMLHSPGMARPMAELGAQIRYASSLSDHDRELAIMATGAVTGCQFEWDSHEPIARAAGVRDEVLAHLQRDEPIDATDREQTLLAFVRELTAGASVSDETFARALDALGPTGVVELASTIGYYTMLSYVMGACQAC